MSLTIDAPDVEAELAAAAEKAGITAEVYALGILRGALQGRPYGFNGHAAPYSPQEVDSGPTSAETLAPFIGMIKGDFGDLSSETGKRFTEGIIKSTNLRLC